MLKNQLGRNIKSLRTAYGETQLELALAVGLDSPNAIANYEKGDRKPKSEIRSRIAAHFRITEEELANSDFSQIQMPSSLFMNKDYMMELTLCMSPIICSENALKSDSFRKGYEAHKRAVEAMKLGKQFEDTDYDICFESYSTACEKEDLGEAAANILWWFLITEISIKNPWMTEMAESIKHATDESEAMLKKYYLRDMSDNMPKQNDSDITLREMEDFEEAITEVMKELKHTTDFSDLVDYYMALRYLMGYVTNELTDEMNRSIGREMMWAFWEMGNKYAGQYLRKCIEINKKNK